MWTFLKLDTMTGQISHVQYGMKPEERFEYTLNAFDITKLLGKKQINGRYKLYPTKNLWTFILLDTIDGGAFQVQWGKECGIFPILFGSVEQEENKRDTEEGVKDEIPSTDEASDKESPLSGILEGLFN